MRLEWAVIAMQIANLRLLHPEIDEDEDTWLLSIESETDAVELLRAIERKRQETAVLAGAIAANVAELELRQDRFKRREKAMRELAFKVLTAADLHKIELPEATLSVVNGQAKVIITDEAIIPDILCKIIRQPDKTRIKEMLKAGTTVRGAELSNSEPHISIRTR